MATWGNYNNGGRIGFDASVPTPAVGQTSITVGVTFYLQLSSPSYFNNMNVKTTFSGLWTGSLNRTLSASSGQVVEVWYRTVEVGLTGSTQSKFVNASMEHFGLGYWATTAGDGVNLTIPAFRPPKPSAPTISSVSRSGSTITVNWNKPANTTSFTLQHRVNGGSWSTVNTSSTSYDRTGAVAGSKYDFRVLAKGDGGSSSYSGIKSYSWAPNAPSALKVTRVSDTQHSLAWTRGSTYTSVVVQRADNGGVWKTVASPTGNLSAYTDATTKADSEYVYRVQGVSQGGSSGASNTVTVYTTPATPAGVTATRLANDDIRVNGTLGRYASRFGVQDDGTDLGHFAVAELPWVHNNPNIAETHKYRLQSRVASGGEGSVTLLSGWSAYSATVQLAAPPNAPTGLTPNGKTVQVGTVRFGWQHNPVDSSEQTAYELRYRVGAGAWTTLTGTTANFRDITLASKDYQWQVRTKGVHPDWSPWSAVATVDVIDVPGVTILSPSSPTHNDAKVTAAWTFFQAQGRPQSAWRARLVLSGQTVETLSGTGSTSTAVFKTRLEDETTYRVEVEAASSGVWSPTADFEFITDFVPPAPGVLYGQWLEGEGANQLSVGAPVQATVADVTNYAPRIEGDGTWAEVRRNQATNPEAAVSGSGWVSNNALEEPVTKGVSVPAPHPAGISTCVEQRSLGNRSTLLNLHTVGGYTPGSLTPGTPVSVYVLVSHVGYRLSGVWGAINPFPAQEWVRLETVVNPDGNVPNISIFSISGKADPSHRAYTTGAVIGDTGPFFDGSTTPATVGDIVQPEDFRWRWLGTPNASESVMEIERVAGLTAWQGIAGVSSWEGKPAIRQIATSPTGSSSTYFNIPTVARSLGTILATSHIPKPLTGTLAGTRMQPRALEPLQFGETPPNVEGSYPQRLVYNGLTELFHAELYHGGRQGSGDVWWSEIGLFEGDYTGEYFDGDTGWVNVDGTWLHTRWNSDGTSIASMPAPAVSYTLERSVKEDEWEHISTSDELEITTLLDFEAVSNGFTNYRITTYASTGAATETIVQVWADSEKIWVNTGETMAHHFWLQYNNAHPTFRGGRNRTLHYFAGRAKPVAYAGQAVTRGVSFSGMITPEQSADEIIEIIQGSYPVHQYRDPEGRRIVGVIESVETGRALASGWYEVQGELTEAER